MNLEEGTDLGPYSIRELLGSGGMGEVYRAKDTRLKREVAIKVLPKHLGDDPKAHARFQREAQSVAALSHPNILAIHDFGRENGVSFAVMELLEGETLRPGMVFLFTQQAQHWLGSQVELLGRRPSGSGKGGGGGRVAARA
ncbi:MAG: protein kinase [Thermoanaerobaculales bacterium]|jgi:serine/threonine protein kinase|nr:protein kinase [Thermoanaerobaculales bacterium]